MGWKLVFLMLLFAGLVSYGKPKPEEKVGGAEWKIRMQSLLREVVDVLPYAFDEASFDNPKNAAKIEKSIRSLLDLSSGLKDHTDRFGQGPTAPLDPTYKVIAEAFSHDLSSAKAASESGMVANRQTQIYLRSAIAKCAMCHSLSVGPELHLAQFKKNFAILRPLDRFSALAATRQFDEALDELSKFLQDKSVTKIDTFSVDKTSKAALAIAVRVKRDPAVAIALLEEINKSEKSSNMLRNDINNWKTSLLEWQSEKTPKLSSAEELFKEAQRLTGSAATKGETKVDLSNDKTISFLRASVHLHDLLLNYPKSASRAETYLLLAAIYEQLPGFMTWDLGEHYLSACIQENPHSAMGERCFEKYQDSLVLGYTGSSGTNMPSAVKKHLNRMKALAQRKEKNS